MRKTLIETKSIQEAGKLLQKLESEFYGEFNKNSDVDFYLFGTSNSCGITMEYEGKYEKQAKWFEMNIIQ